MRENLCRRGHWPGNALNLPNEMITRLSQLCMPLNPYMGALQLGQAIVSQMRTARDAALQIIELLWETPPFSILDYKYVKRKVDTVFTEDYLQNAIDFVASGTIVGAVSPEYQKAMMLLCVLPVMAHMGYSIGAFKKEMAPFAEKLHDSNRTAEGYAVIFGQHFVPTPETALNTAAWMSTANTSIQYVTAAMPGKPAPQLVKRMHYVSFVGMFLSDLFEGLCVGHAPRKCPICGRWLLTTDARRTKYCNGLAPGDKYRRTCRQIGNIKGRAQRELAFNHPWKRIYERRMNTIIQKLRRGTLDEQTAIAMVMKRLAKDKMERAISNHAYANGSYESEMTQEALLAEAQKYLK